MTIGEFIDDCLNSIVGDFVYLTFKFNTETFDGGTIAIFYNKVDAEMFLQKVIELNDEPNVEYFTKTIHIERLS